LKRIGIICGACAIVLTTLVPVFALSAAPAMADQTVLPLCPGGDGTAVSGTYARLTITSNEYVASGDTLTVGWLTLAPGSCLDAFSMSTVVVGGNLFVGKGATLALGCSLGAVEPGTPTPCTGSTNDTVGGSIIADQPMTMYLTADTVGGSVLSLGGGPGLGSPPATPFVNFPIKENNIHGNLTVLGWHGGWIGALRNHVGGNMIIAGNVSVLDSDSTEVITNTVGGDLICFANYPAAQFGDAIQVPGAGPNVVSGHKLGQCAGL
jgi:hypothetical protein